MSAPGFVVCVNGQELASVSSVGLNILSVRLHGDVVGEELASIDLTGGFYGEGEESKHLIWLSDYEISENDEVEIAFDKNSVTSKAGKTIDELHPERSEAMGPWQSMEQIYEDLAKQRKVRSHYVFEFEHSSGSIKLCQTDPDEFSFGLNIMWKWLKPESASIWLSSNTLEGIRDQKNGSEHVRAQLKPGESVKVRVKT